MEVIFGIGFNNSSSNIFPFFSPFTEFRQKMPYPVRTLGAILVNRSVTGGSNCHVHIIYEMEAFLLALPACQEQ